MENEPRNLTIGTLLRVAHVLGSTVEIKLVRRKRDEGGAADWRGERQNPQPPQIHPELKKRALTPKAAARGV